jgi:hypothetical protein
MTLNHLEFERYEDSGFLGLQMAIDLAYLEEVKAIGPSIKNSLQIEVQAFPYPPYIYEDKSHYATVLANLLPSAIIIGFAYMASITIFNIVKERKTGIKVKNQKYKHLKIA